MMAVILAGGKGTRLVPQTISIPKPLIPLGEVPILEIIICQLRASGVRRVVLSLGHMSYFFADYLKRWRRYGIDIDCVLEDEPLGTAGPLALIDRLDDDFIVMNGDLLTTLDYRAFFERHTAGDAWATIAVSRRDLTLDYGVIRTTCEGGFEDYMEKPVISHEVSMGINAVSRRCLDLIPEGSRFDMPELMLAIRDTGNRVSCYRTSCYWQDIGRPSDLQQATADFLAEPMRFMPVPKARE